MAVADLHGSEPCVGELGNPYCGIKFDHFPGVKLCYELFYSKNITASMVADHLPPERRVWMVVRNVPVARWWRHQRGIPFDEVVRVGRRHGSQIGRRLMTEGLETAGGSAAIVSDL